jgi:hypothetical protein
MAKGKYVAYLPLEGLHPEDAYALASRLLEYLGIDRAKAPYAELRELLKQLDYHPLAIQLVLPALGEFSLTLAQIKADFSSLLSYFKDDTETGRNRSLLAALLTAEQVEGITIPFLHFHPVLAPYLRSQPGANDLALRARYAQRYARLADYLYGEDYRHTREVRALAQKELPNLRCALELLLEAGELDIASEMAESIARFLDYFGLLRERDELRQDP